MTETTCTCPRCGQPHYLGFGPDTVAEKDAEIGRLKEELRAVLKHVEDLRAERHSTKQMLEDVLEKYGLGSKTPHYGVGRSGIKKID